MTVLCILLVAVVIYAICLTIKCIKHNKYLNKYKNYLKYIPLCEGSCSLADKELNVINGYRFSSFVFEYNHQSLRDIVHVLNNIKDMIKDYNFYSSIKNDDYPTISFDFCKEKEESNVIRLSIIVKKNKDK